MQKQVAIVAYKQTKHDSDIQKTRERILFELVNSLLSDVGITREEVDTFVMASNDFYDGRTISNVYTVPAVGAYMKDETKVESDGINACIYGAMRILSGWYSTALIVGHSQGGSHFRPYLAMSYTFDPVYERQIGLLNELSAAALQANSYMGRFGMKIQTLHKIAVKSLRNAAKNPNALRKKEDATIEDVINSERLYTPLHKMHCYPPTDGACAILLASAERAKSLTDKPVWIRGMSSSMETYYFGERELFRSRSTTEAAKRAYSMAGIKNPTDEIDVVEISAHFAHQEPILVEALGLFDEGSADRVIEDGLTEFDGKIPVNLSGGSLCANPLCATGMVRIVEVAMQLRGEADNYQLKNPSVGIAHSQDGICAQHNAVLVLSN